MRWWFVGGLVAVGCSAEAPTRLNDIELAFLRAVRVPGGPTETQLRGAVVGEPSIELFTPAPGEGVGAPQWSLDGTMLAASAGQGGVAQILVLTLATGDTQRFAVGGWPQWSATKAAVFFTSQRNDATQELELVRVDVSSERVEVVEPVLIPGARSRDWRQRAYSCSTEQDGTPALCIEDLDTDNVTEVPLPASELGDFYSTADIRWSPTGEFLAFIAPAADREVDSAPFILDVASRELLRPTPTYYDVREPVWNLTGDRVSFAANGFDAIYPTDYAIPTFGLDGRLLETHEKAISLAWGPGGIAAVVRWQSDNIIGSTYLGVTSADGSQWRSTTDASNHDDRPAWRPVP